MTHVSITVPIISYLCTTLYYIFISHYRICPSPNPSHQFPAAPIGVDVNKLYVGPQTIRSLKSISTIESELL